MMGATPRLMEGLASDLRLLKLAALYEEAYERFVHDVAMRTVEDEDLRARLLALTPPDDAHAERILVERRRIEAVLAREDRSAILLGALLDVVDVEREARSFYLSSLPQVRDPRVARLFRDLAREEDAHVGIAEGVLRDAKAAAPPAASALTPEELAMASEDGPLLREGVTDFGPTGA